MSCKLKKLVSIKEKLTTIRNILFTDDYRFPVPSSADDWHNTLHDDSDDVSSRVSVPDSLNDCLSAISPFADIIVFANGNNVTVYRCREESDSQICGTTLFELEPGEKITAISCLPFVSQQISNQGGLDWCSIILGFNSGFIRIYTENMSLLLSQKLSNEPVTCIKIQSFCCPYTSGRTYHMDCTKNSDEIFVFFQSLCLIIEGFTFYQTLRSCRNYLARNRGHAIPDYNTGPEFALRFKKWQFKNFNKILDADNCGLREFSQYDHLVSQSLDKGAYANPRARSTNGNLIITAGEDPFIGIHKTDENDSTTILEEVTQAVVNKVKNVLPTFLRSSDKPRQKLEPPLEFSDSLELYDQYRIGVSISVSPSRELAAVCDDFGRVTLVSLADGVAVRMWKGYRDAQCGWIEAQEDPSDIYSKRVLFLCIYAPKRGLLEIWRCQHGPRVDAFNVGKTCRLHYCGYSMLGLNDILINQYRHSSNLFVNSPAHCYLFDYESCTLFSIEVPFVSSLTERFTQRSKDELLLKEFKNISDETNSNDNNNHQVFLSPFERMKTHQVKWDAINHAITLSNVSLVISLCSAFSRDLPTVDSIKTDPALLNLSRKCRKILQLCKFYESFQTLTSTINGLKISPTIHKNPPDIESQAEALGWSPNDYVRCISLFSFQEVVSPGRDEMIQPSPLSFSEMISFFSLDSDDSTADEDEQPICLKNTANNFKIHDLYKLGDFLLLPGLVGDNLESCASIIEQARPIAPQEILYTIYASWLHNDFSLDWMTWPRFNRYVCLFVNPLKKGNLIEPTSWFHVLKTLYLLIAQSTRITSALIGAIILKTLYSSFEACEEASKMIVDNEQDQQEINATEEWENLSIEKEKLILLINQLENTFFLSLILHSNSEYNPGDISLTYLMESNPGIISELVAKWVISYPLEPSIMLAINEEANELDNGDGPLLSTGIDIAASLGEGNLLDHDVAKQLLQKVRDQFPHSLESDVILANCSWECLALWNKDPSMSNSSLLCQSLKYLTPISSAVLKHNIACLIWKTFILKRFETLAQLIEKMGKTPKDRILKRDVGIGDGSLENFVTFTVDLLDLIVDTIGLADSEALPLFRLDEWWKHRICPSSQLPLVFVAVQQKPAHPELILQIYDLAIVINLIVNFQIKQFKPLSLFPVDVRKALFGELFLTLSNSLSDSQLNQSREKFLQASATVIAQSIPPSTTLSEDEARLHSVANQWFSKVILLAKDWGLEPDSVRRRYICDLYLNGCDTLADEVINTTRDREELANDLLKVAGLRVVHLMRNDKDRFISSMPPNIFTWLENLPSNMEVNQDVTSSSTRSLLEYISSFLSDDNPRAKIASNLLAIVKKL